MSTRVSPPPTIVAGVYDDDNRRRNYGYQSIINIQLRNVLAFDRRSESSSGDHSDAGTWCVLILKMVYVIYISSRSLKQIPLIYYVFGKTTYSSIITRAVDNIIDIIIYGRAPWTDVPRLHVRRCHRRPGGKALRRLLPNFIELRDRTEKLKGLFSLGATVVEISVIYVKTNFVSDERKKRANGFLFEEFRIRFTCARVR